MVQAFDQSVAWMGLCGVSGYIQLGGEGTTQNLRDRLYISSGLEHFAVLPGDPKCRCEKAHLEYPVCLATTMT